MVQIGVFTSLHGTNWCIFMLQDVEDKTSFSYQSHFDVIDNNHSSFFNKKRSNNILLSGSNWQLHTHKGPIGWHPLEFKLLRIL